MNTFMKKLFSIIFAVILLVSQSTFVFAAENTDNESGAFLAEDAVSALPNVYAKMRAEGNKTIKIGYFGGSVTNGYGTSISRDNCWRIRTTNWLNETYGDAYNVTFAETAVHAGAGGTGTHLNTYRTVSALELHTETPIDLLFIEFAINDNYKNESYAKSAYYMESIIQIVRNKAPECDIVVLLTTDSSKLDTEFANAKAHADVAAHYGIPTFWFGKYMTPFIISEKAALYNAEADSYIAANPDSSIKTREQYFAANNIDITKIQTGDDTKEPWLTYYMDACHPNDNGYGKYFEFLRDNFLKANLDDISGCSTTVTNHTLPAINYNATEAFKSVAGADSEFYNADLRADAHSVPISEVENANNAYGFAIGSTAMTSTMGGASFRAIFNSKTAGIHTKGSTTGGILLYSVDGGDYKYFNLYHSDNSRDNMYLFYDGLEDEETHTVDVILRTGTEGTTCNLYDFFIDGDSDYSGVSFTEAPNTTPIPDLYTAEIILTPDFLNQYISADHGATLSVVHNAQDIDVLRYTPITSNNYKLSSDCYKRPFTDVSIPTYKYAVLNYFYEVAEGQTANAEARQALNIKNSANAWFRMYSAGEIVTNTPAASVFDLTAITNLGGASGKLVQMHVFPFGYSVRGTAFSANELMDVANITFYPEYPFDTPPIQAAVNKGITSSETTVDLSGKNILPSVYPYAKIKYSYTGSTADKIKLGFDGIYNIKTLANDIAVSVNSNTIKSGTGNEVIVNLSALASCGASRYLESVKLSADIASGETLTVDSITFYSEHPNPDALCEIKFDANGGEGMLPETAFAKIGSTYTVPEAHLIKEGYAFIGWNTDKAATEVISTLTVPEDGATLYAIYKVPTIVYLSADGSVTDGGQTYTDNVYTTVSAAITAIGANPGKIIFAGDISLSDIGTAQNKSSSPLMIFHGADGKDKKSTISFTATQTHLYSNTVFENLDIIDANNKDGYINMNGKDLTIGTKGQNDITVKKPDGTARTVMPLMCGGNLTVNSGSVSNASVGYEAGITNNASITVNGGNVVSIRGGALSFSDSNYTFTENVTLTLNGGTYANGYTIRVSTSDTRTTTINGASSLIANNGIIDTYNLAVKEFKYVINSAQGGAVSLYKEGSAAKAPTFKIAAAGTNDKIYIDGALAEATDGVYLFTPASTGTFKVTYQASAIAEISARIKLGREHGKAPLASNLLRLEIRDSASDELLRTIVLEDENSIPDEDGYITVNISEDVSDITAENLTVTAVKNGYAPYSVSTTKAGLVSTIEAMFTSSDAFENGHGDIKENYAASCGDGVINMFDFVRVLRGFTAIDTPEYKQYAQAVDLDEDGTVTVSDLDIIKNNFGYGTQSEN